MADQVRRRGRQQYFPAGDVLRGAVRAVVVDSTDDFTDVPQLLRAQLPPVQGKVTIDELDYLATFIVWECYYRPVRDWLAGWCCDFGRTWPLCRFALWFDPEVRLQGSARSPGVQHRFCLLRWLD